MKGFKVILNGKNFYIHSQGSTKVFGFYATRLVEANTEIEAQEKAMHVVMDDKNLQDAMRNPSDTPPQIYIEEVEQINFSEEDLSNNHVFMFYESE